MNWNFQKGKRKVMFEVQIWNTNFEILRVIIIKEWSFNQLFILNFS